MAEQHGSVCILVVDDHGDSLELIVRVLTRAGYGVLALQSAEEALEAARSGRCDLVISDIGIPGRDGLSLMRELRQDYGLRGIALSGFARAQDQEAAREAGFERFLPKPVEIPHLLAAVRELIPASAPGTPQRPPNAGPPTSIKPSRA